MLHPEPGEQGVRREPPECEGEQQHVQQLGGGHRVTAAVPAHLSREALFREEGHSYTVVTTFTDI